MAVAVALLHRERTGEGQFIDCSLLDTYLQMHEDYIPRIGLSGTKALPMRSGSNIQMVALQEFLIVETALTSR